MKRVPIPRDWTGEQALAVLDWLQGIVDAIWDCLLYTSPSPRDRG